MVLALENYIADVNAQFATGQAREHSYRPALQRLLEALLPKLTVTNEPARIACGAPDFILTDDNLPVAFVETKDLFDGDLDGRTIHREQFTRYRQSLATIVFTDYLDFHLYESDALVSSVRLADERNGKIVLLPESVEAFLALINRLASADLQPITSSARLAEHMAAKARLLKTTIQTAFANAPAQDVEQDELSGYYEAFRQVLIHDLEPNAFADIYAQTIVYGMFAARLHDPTPETFSRHEAAELIPPSNPFLRRIFQQISGYDLDPRIAWIVDDLVRTFRAADVNRIMHSYGKSARHSDPLIHFYEDFLAAYDPKLRDQRGVYYTPEPVVRFIVSAVDQILRRDFALPYGLADYSKISRPVVNDAKTKTRDAATVMRDFHRVQILDPATGTGTFLAEVINQIYTRYYATNKGLWQSYAEEHLLPRIHGFELMMAPYAIAHLKMDMTLRETGYVHQNNKRFRIYLTNSLEECHAETGTLFASWLANEANEANYIKRDTPVMVMLGNPPYSVSSSNKGDWIQGLLEDYKKGLNERNIQPLSDDYIKFIRYGHHMVAKNGSGILAYISNNSFLDGIIHRQMRHALLEEFDDIYILNLHGNSRTKETAPDGSKDENVFDIIQGVSINIFVKHNRRRDASLGGDASLRRQNKDDKKSLLTDAGSVASHATVHYADLYGKRAVKYAALDTETLETVNWQILVPTEPYYFLAPKDFSAQEEYEKGFRIDELMKVNSSGVKTHHDAELISLKPFETEYNQKYDYRPFDQRFINYDLKKVVRHRFTHMRHMLQKNVGLILGRQGQVIGDIEWCLVYCTQSLIDTNIYYRGGGILFPLYLYPEEGELKLGSDASLRRQNEDGKKSLFTDARSVATQSATHHCTKNPVNPENPCDNQSPTPNFDPTILSQIESTLDESIAPLELFDYIYAVLHTPSYRERYKEFLKIDFPRIPYPQDAARYHALAAIGSQLRRLHLMEACDTWQVSVSYPEPGDNLVEKPRYDEAANRVYINKTQYFENVTPTAWNFFIGGYQPAQKWLKDRKSRTLAFADIIHYTHLIHALTETAKLMEELEMTSPITS